jgi:hypothetical protein
LISGNIPDQSQVKQLTENLRRRSQLPYYVYKLLLDLPKETHPMTQLSMAVLALQPESTFAQAYMKGTVSESIYLACQPRVMQWSGYKAFQSRCTFGVDVFFLSFENVSCMDYQYFFLNGHPYGIGKSLWSMNARSLYF